jgi:hypothetical protein
MVFQPRNRIIFREENDVNFSRCQFFTPPCGIKSMAAPASEKDGTSSPPFWNEIELDRTMIDREGSAVLLYLILQD